MVGIVKTRNWMGKGYDGGLLFQFYAPRYCLRQARVSDGDSQNRTSSVCLRQTLCLKEKQKGQFFVFAGLAMSGIFRVCESKNGLVRRAC